MIEAISLILVVTAFVVWHRRRSAKDRHRRDSLAFLERHWWAGQRNWRLGRRGMHQ